MRMYFDYYGNNFRDYKIHEIAPDYIQFDSEDKEYIIDLTGELDFGCEPTHITGRFKGDVINIEPKGEMAQSEIKKAIFLWINQLLNLACLRKMMNQIIKNWILQF